MEDGGEGRNIGINNQMGVNECCRGLYRVDDGDCWVEELQQDENYWRVRVLYSDENCRVVEDC